MKKVKKYFFCLAAILLISAVLILANKSLAKDKDKKEISKISYIDIDSKEFKDSIMDAFKEEYGENYKEIVEKNAKSTELATKIDLKFMNKKTGEINYPSDFGGQYINDNNELVVQIVKNSNEKITIKSTVSDISNEIKYEYVNNSYEDLEEINNKIIEYFTSEGAINKGLTANYVDVINNIVVVELKNNSEEEQNWFKTSVVDSNLIKFVKNDKPMALTTTYNAGGSINDACSIGYRAKRNGVNGFVTAAHCYNLDDDIIGYGTVIDRQKDYANGIDGEFVKLSSGNSVTNTIQWATYPTTKINTITSLYQALVVGGNIAKSGYKTKATTGKITELNHSSTNLDGTYNAKFVLTSADCNNGDSGGVVYKPGTAASGGTVVGIVHAKKCTTKECDQPGPMSFSRSDWLDSKLSLSRY